MSRTSPAPTLEEFFDELINALELDDFKQARASMDPAAMMVPELSRRFFVDLQSVNTRELRDRDLTLTRHSVKIAFWVPTTHGPFSEVMRASFEREKHITDALTLRIRSWSSEYVGTDRKLNSSREMLGVTVKFNLKSYHRMAY